MARVARNERGWRIGQTHHRARYTDDQVRAVMTLHYRTQWGWRRISAALKLNVHWVKAVLSGRLRLAVRPEGIDLR